MDQEIKTEEINSLEENIGTQISLDIKEEIRSTYENLQDTWLKKDEQPDDPINSIFKQEEVAQTHSEEQTPNFVCDHCHKIFPAESDLRRHKKVFKDSKKDCILCEEKFCTNEQLKRHKKEVHNNKNERHTEVEDKERTDLTAYQCSKCDYRCYDKYNFKRHTLIHTDEEGSLFICDICHKVSRNRFALQAHILYVHKAEKKHQCSFCNLKFKRKHDLKLHLPIHESKYLFECPQCRGAFKNLSNLNMHRKKNHPKEFEKNENSNVTVTDVPSVKPENEESLIDKNDSRTGSSRMYKCKICNRELRTLLSLKEHVSHHTGKPLYNCSFCPLVFYARASLFRHNRTVHPKEWEAAVLKSKRTKAPKIQNDTSENAETE